MFGDLDSEQARQTTAQHALAQLDTSQQRLLDAYLAGVLDLVTFQRKQDELRQRQAGLHTQRRQLDAAAHQQIALSAIAESLDTFCAQVRTGLSQATFDQRPTLVELLIDRVIVTNGEVEIRYVFPTLRDGPFDRFCPLRLDYLDLPAALVAAQRAAILRCGLLPIAPVRCD